jgi:hypothetical protein
VTLVTITEKGSSVTANVCMHLYLCASTSLELEVAGLRQKMEENRQLCNTLYLELDSYTRLTHSTEEVNQKQGIHTSLTFTISVQS